MVSGSVFEIADVPPEGPNEQNTPERVRTVYDIYFRWFKLITARK